ncbi:MAG: hypothetical protein DRI65_00250 [Chloroflexota bacterium]|nr:MAG: hypothetical protein DRI65_00250 [Chloroflexota bacterium]
MFPVINIGPLSLPSSALILLLGFWLGTSLAERQANQAGAKTDILFKVIWGVILAGIMGARLSFIARNPGAFQGQWTSVFSLNSSLLDPVGGAVISLLVGYFLAVKYQVATWSILDDLVPVFAVLAPALYLSKFATGSGFGMITNLPWGIDLWGGTRHPVQIYLLVSSLAVLYLVVFKRSPKQRQAGSTMLSFTLYTSGYLTILSTFQDPAGNLISGFRVYQLIYWTVLTIGIIVYIKLKTKEVKNALG